MQDAAGKKEHRLSLAVKMNLVTTGMILLVAGGLLLISYIVQGRRVTAMYYNRVETAATNAADLVDPDLLRSFRDKVLSEEFSTVRDAALSAGNPDIVKNYLESQPSYYYEELRNEEANSGEGIDHYESLAFDYEVLSYDMQVARSGAVVTDVYIQYDKDGVTRNLVDPNEDFLYLGSIEEELPEFAAMEDNGYFPATVHKSRYGWLCSAYVPIKDTETGEAIAVVGADVDMNTIMQARKEFLVNSIIFVLLLTGLCILLNIFLIRRLAVDPLKKLTDAACGFAAVDREYTKDDIIHVDIKSNDEIGDLYHEIQEMQSRIVDYTGRMTTYAAEQSRIGTELELANRIQMSILPEVGPEIKDRKEFLLRASMTPAKEVGGDFYNFFLIDKDHLGLVMADVSGKGVPAALFMMASMILLKDLAVPGRKPSEILTQANNDICRNNKAKMFVTVWLGILEISTGHMTCASAGHEFPAVRGEDKTFRLFKDPHGFVLGGMEDMKYKDYELKLSPGDALFVYTDGVPEANDAAGAFFGTDRMEEALNLAQPGHPKDILMKVRESVETFAGGAEQFDDMTMMCLEYCGPGGA
ncbi:MAG: PP2C family protein-serine/threonine phosphatase [Clostridium sp.]|nr:PP2C family protein-serine/threonine phosphatase [Clostridium sp.]